MNFIKVLLLFLFWKKQKVIFNRFIKKKWWPSQKDEVYIKRKTIFNLKHFPYIFYKHFLCFETNPCIFIPLIFFSISKLYVINKIKLK